MLATKIMRIVKIDVAMPKLVICNFLMRLEKLLKWKVGISKMSSVQVSFAYFVTNLTHYYEVYGYFCPNRLL